MRTAEKIEGEICPKCGSKENQQRTGRSPKGNPRCRCKNCNLYYTINVSPRRYPEEVKEQAIKAYYSGLSARQVGKLFHMNKANVLNWIKKAERSADKSEDEKR